MRSRHQIEKLGFTATVALTMWHVSVPYNLSSTADYLAASLSAVLSSIDWNGGFETPIQHSHLFNWQMSIKPGQYLQISAGPADRRFLGSVTSKLTDPVRENGRGKDHASCR